MKSHPWLLLVPLAAVPLMTAAQALGPGYAPHLPSGYAPSFPPAYAPGLPPGYGAATVARPPAPPAWPARAAEPATSGERLSVTHSGAQASAILEAGVEKLLAFLRQGGESPNRLQVAAFLDREIAPYFDFERMARWVAGPAFEQLGEEGQRGLRGWIEADFLTVLTRELAVFQGQGVRMQGARRMPDGSVVVRMTVARPGRPPTRLEFRMAEAADGWKVYDVVADGQSAVAQYRVRFQQRQMQMQMAQPQAPAR